MRSGRAATSSARAFAANVTLPGNTIAQLCLPRYLLVTSSTDGTCEITVDGKVRPLLRGGQTGGMACLASDLGPGGSYVTELRC